MKLQVKMLRAGSNLVTACFSKLGVEGDFLNGSLWFTE